MESESLLAGRYDIGEPIGEGASAVVHRGWDRQANAAVAIKILRPHLQGDEIRVRRFEREIRITRALEHPRIVTVHDLVHEAGRLCLVMKLAEGRSLDRWIALEGPGPIGEAVSIVRQVLEILGACHRKHVLHRDLKPRNIIVRPDGIVELLDFGVARMAELGDLTQTGTTLGSPEFMAPELFEQHRADPRTDLYAVGIVAFELLAGQPPFRGDSLVQLHSMHATAPVPSLGQLRGDVPAWLQHFVERLLAKRPFERYQSAEEALADLAARRVVARELPRSARRVCLRCGEDGAADVPICVRCGAERSAGPTKGDRNVHCAPDTDDAKLAAFVEATFGLRIRRRRRRTLVLSLVDSWTAEVVTRRARDFGVTLVTVPRPTLLAVRKLGWLAVAAYLLITFPIGLSRELAYYGRYYLDRLDAFLVLQMALVFAIIWIALRCALALEDRPLVRWKPTPTPVAAAELAWIERLRPSLDRERPEALVGLVGGMLEAYFTLVRSAARIEPGMRVALQAAIEKAAALATAVAAIEARLQDRAPAERAEEREMLEERVVALTGDLVAVHATFNRLCGRALVLRAPLDDEDRRSLDGHVAALARDAEIAREVRTALERRP